MSGNRSAFERVTDPSPCPLLLQDVVVSQMSRPGDYSLDVAENSFDPQSTCVDVSAEEVKAKSSNINTSSALPWTLHWGCKQFDNK